MNNLGNPLDAYLPRVSDQYPADGCSKCRYGIVEAPLLTRACALYLERIVQMTDNQIVFCDCHAGRLYRVYLLNARRKLIEEARRDKRLTYWGGLGTHPDIASARRAIADSYAMMPAPTIRLVKEL